MKLPLKHKIIEAIVYFTLFPLLGMVNFVGSKGGHDVSAMFLVFLSPAIMAYFFVFRSDSIKESFTKIGIYFAIWIVGYFVYIKNSFGEYIGFFILSLVFSAIAYGIKKLIQKNKGNK